MNQVRDWPLFFFLSLLLHCSLHISCDLPFCFLSYSSSETSFVVLVSPVIFSRFSFSYVCSLEMVIVVTASKYSSGELSGLLSFLLSKRRTC